MNIRIKALSVLLLAALLGSCTAEKVSAPDALLIPTNVSQPTVEIPGDVDTLLRTLPPPPTMAIEQDAGAEGESISEEATPESAPVEPVYRIVFVEEGDVLNARSGPGVDNDVVGTLSPDEYGIAITGRGQLSSGSTWVPVSASGTAGWVNSRFLKDASDEQAFCEVQEVQDLLDDLKSAIEGEDGGQLSQLIHPERGIRVRLNWWNPEVLIRGDELEELFSSATVYEWGVADGSGDAIEGAFSEVVVPMLVEDLSGATEMACNEILEGGSAGIIQLPENYPEQGFYSFHRPGTDEFSGLNWGSWVVGIEKWQGAYFVSFLVHFDWEI